LDIGFVNERGSQPDGFGKANAFGQRMDEERKDMLLDHALARVAA
jgi:hypothetical protein